MKPIGEPEVWPAIEGCNVVVNDFLIHANEPSHDTIWVLGSPARIDTCAHF